MSPDETGCVTPLRVQYGLMKADQLRQMQAPLKERYRTSPASARTPLAAHGDFESEDITATVHSWAGPVRAGLHRATGGSGQDACSADMLVEAVLACAGVTLRSVATALGIEIRTAALSADGVFDARGTLGVDRSAPVGVTDLVVTIELETDASEEMLHKLGSLTERYCVVGQSLKQPPQFVVRRTG